MFGFKCKKGFSERNGKCVRNEAPQVLSSCIMDGKKYCAPGDKPLKPPIARPGGKSQIAEKIIEKAPPHKTYVEPFVGGGAVFLKKPLAQKNVINDKDSDVATVFKSFKEGEGFDKCDMTPSKEKFDRIKNKPNKTACDVAYLNKLSFGSQMTSYADKKFTGKGNRETGIKYQKAHKEDYKKKLQNTKVTNQDFKQVMQQNDSPETFHYLDPPYVGTQDIYKEGKKILPQEVCETAKRMRGKVMISYNDNPEVRRKCYGLKMTPINTRYVFAANSNNKKAKELLITNY